MKRLRKRDGDPEGDRFRVKTEIREIRQTPRLRGRNIKPGETQTAWGGV